VCFSVLKISAYISVRSLVPEGYDGCDVAAYKMQFTDRNMHHVPSLFWQGFEELVSCMSTVRYYLATPKITPDKNKVQLINTSGSSSDIPGFSERSNAEPH
jgi:hypothetical protein